MPIASGSFFYKDYMFPIDLHSCTSYYYGSITTYLDSYYRNKNWYYAGQKSGYAVYFYPYASTYLDGTNTVYIGSGKKCMDPSGDIFVEYVKGSPTYTLCIYNYNTYEVKYTLSGSFGNMSGYISGISESGSCGSVTITKQLSSLTASVSISFKGSCNTTSSYSSNTVTVSATN